MSNSTLLVAPCGINCTYCYRRMKTKVKCTGCRGSNDNKTKTILNCKIRTCKIRLKNNYTFCFKCSNFPCENVVKLNKRYETTYKLSLIDNLNYIKQNGIEKFLKFDKQRYTCKTCNEIVCIHDVTCKNCDK